MANIEAAGAIPGQKARRSAEPGMWGYFKKCLRLYAVGAGRASRAEYWSFIFFSWVLIILFVAVGAVILGAIEGGGAKQALGGAMGVTFLIALLAMIVPHLAVCSRRMHDIGLTGWLTPLIFIPYIGSFFMLVVALIPSQAQTNRYGPPPGMADASVADVFS
jgi:uncharacterized membrane protein YhaH (DUF805 family)